MPTRKRYFGKAKACDVLRCPLCKNQFTDIRYPVVAPQCGHSLCVDCAFGTRRNTNVCFTCGSQSYYGPRGRNSRLATSDRAYSPRPWPSHEWKRNFALLDLVSEDSAEFREPKATMHSVKRADRKSSVQRDDTGSQVPETVVEDRDEKKQKRRSNASDVAEKKSSMSRPQMQKRNTGIQLADIAIEDRDAEEQNRRSNASDVVDSNTSMSLGDFLKTQWKKNNEKSQVNGSCIVRIQRGLGQSLSATLASRGGVWVTKMKDQNNDKPFNYVSGQVTPVTREARVDAYVRGQQFKSIDKLLGLGSEACVEKEPEDLGRLKDQSGMAHTNGQEGSRCKNDQESLTGKKVQGGLGQPYIGETALARTTGLAHKTQLDDQLQRERNRLAQGWIQATRRMNDEKTARENAEREKQAEKMARERVEKEKEAEKTARENAEREKQEEKTARECVQKEKDVEKTARENAEREKQVEKMARERVEKEKQKLADELAEMKSKKGSDGDIGVDCMKCCNCSTKERRERMKICGTCACANNVVLKDAEESKILPFTICTFCSQENHLGHHILKYVTWKAGSNLNSSVNRAETTVTSMDELWTWEIVKRNNRLQEWKQQLNFFRTLHEKASIDDFARVEGLLNDEAALVARDRQSALCQLESANRTIETSLNRLSKLADQFIKQGKVEDDDEVKIVELPKETNKMNYPDSLEYMANHKLSKQEEIEDGDDEVLILEPPEKKGRVAL